jgi:xanthine dehydrogenase iron-sulfur cluster and FAD-binding subunit A
VAEHVPALAEAAAVIGAAQIQNRGTLGGNVMNASPAGDTLPILLAADAEMVLCSALEERTVAASAFWPAYRTTVRRRDELLRCVRLPIVTGRHMRFWKVGTREAQAISKVVLAMSWRLYIDERWHDVHIALGSVAPTPIRLPRTEAVLEGQRPDAQVVDRAATGIATEIEPIDDVRSTAEYRRMVAARVLARILREEGHL